MKYWYLDLKIIHGEVEIHSKTAHKTTAFEGDFDANDYAQDYYDGGESDGFGGFNFSCGEINVSVYKCEEITIREYDVLSRFL
jgi:hypothetical protein